MRTARPDARALPGLRAGLPTLRAGLPGADLHPRLILTAPLSDGHAPATRCDRTPSGPVTPASSADGSYEPPGQLAEQILLIVAGPCHVAVRPQQRGGHVQFPADVGDVVDPVCPARNRQPAGLVEQQPAAAVHQRVESPLLQLDVPQPTADKRMLAAEVVADSDRGDLLDQVAVHLLKVH